MKKYIEAMACAEKISEAFGIPIGDLADVFADIPAADVVEVVRCKDCAYYREENGYCMNPHCGKSYYGTPTRKDQYCGFGERDGG